mmetsp:Transcript_2661/g.4120  ORF Transcript_2661/g.4120 Transcript_2661/m.4120 type:complete len:81 (+) Transcript_2661:462-704(+)
MGATSKYRGVCFHKATKKWRARIEIDGKEHHIGCYANEEDAAVDYARAVFKYNKKRESFSPLEPLPCPIPKKWRRDIVEP